MIPGVNEFTQLLIITKKRKKGKKSVAEGNWKLNACVDNRTMGAA